MVGMVRMALAIAMLGWSSLTLAGRPIGHPPAPQRHALYFTDSRPEADALARLAGRWEQGGVRVTVQGTRVRISGPAKAGLAGTYRLFAHRDGLYAIGRRSADPDRLREGRPALSTERAACHVIMRLAMGADGRMTAVPISEDATLAANAGIPAGSQDGCGMGFLAKLDRHARARLVFADGTAPSGWNDMKRVE